MKILLHKQTTAIARQFKGTLIDAEDIKDWSDGTEISWAPIDENYNNPVEQKPDLSKGVTLDVVSHFGFQNCDEGDWLVKDPLGVSVYTTDQLTHYFSEGALNEQ